MASTLSPARAPRRDALENREAILAAAAVVFRRDPESSLDAVAAQAGLSRRAIYGHFSSREQLLDEMLVRGGARVASALRYVHDDDPRVHLALIGGALWGEVQQVKVLVQLALHGPLEKTIADALEPVRASVRRAAASGVERGWFRADIAPEGLARLIEDAAIAVLDEAVRARLSDTEGRRLVMSMGLSAAGLSWREANAVLDEHPELLSTAPATRPVATASASAPSHSTSTAASTTSTSTGSSRS